MHDSCGAYTYEPLSEQNTRIRIISVLPGTIDSDVVVRIQETSLSSDDREPYTTLSYTWGDRKRPVRIGVMHPSSEVQAQGYLEVTGNLHEALIHLRGKNQPQKYWIDAICINQQDLAERSAQVRLMSQIFINAVSAMVWLGPTADDSQLAISKLQEWHDTLQDFDPQKPQYFDVDGQKFEFCSSQTVLDGDSPELGAIYALTMRNWFERLWIRQEIYHSQDKALMVCGRHSISWLSFRRAYVGIFRNRAHAFKVGRYIPDLRPVATRSRLIWQIANVDSSLGLIFRNACDAQCEDPRDNIFGVLGMLPHEYAWLREAIVVDYTLSVGAVYSNCAAQIIQHDQSLDILRYCEFKANSGQPTWAPGWNLLKTNTASPGYAAVLSRARIHSAIDTMLTVSGLSISRISRTFKTNPAEPVQQTYAKVEILKTLVAELIATKLFASQEIMMEHLVAVIINHTPHEEVWNLSSNMWPCANARSRYSQTLITILDTRIDELEEVFQKDSWAKAVLNTFSTIRGYAAITTEGNLLIGPADMMEGDVVTVLLGLDNAIVLRPTSGDPYEVIGVCTMPSIDAG